MCNQRPILSTLPPIIQFAASVMLSIGWRFDMLAYSEDRMLDGNYMFTLAMGINALTIACICWSVYNGRYVFPVVCLGLFNLAIGLIMPAFYASSVF